MPTGIWSKEKGDSGMSELILGDVTTIMSFAPLRFNGSYFIDASLS
ncbi:hypothetical protein VIOR3934_08044 [Vibrio orientalis CIP 102891 = ATCC 33934]|uniref:Uncharacterized protein n=1 Tax=Vibrio orientalis CIP 102891 = ATCC 33934 TaxID=675816 RepID=F9ST32_VIBOR|nr:hypothetical protein VIOR3934_08044 [Vibrio orientalis CIP 102891 = ATCC 33934]